MGSSLLKHCRRCNGLVNRGTGVTAGSRLQLHAIQEYKCRS
ncbi:hypothetical protein bas34_0099 [Escherichia phage SelmaRatti]|uniref:Uncharacterized protein n=1 Tax=Escherichia phage SelmaRatti TaxID=2852006 RepID=A0AAE7VYJ5_9CAUD|nr:hypothetical protein bas34_0099 [Escherichia phage SelmaRatti]